MLILHSIVLYSNLEDHSLFHHSPLSCNVLLDNFTVASNASLELLSSSIT